VGISTASAQKILNDAEGHKIVVFDDGSWRYFERADTIYEKSYTDHEEEFFEREKSANNINPLENPSFVTGKIEGKLARRYEKLMKKGNEALEDSRKSYLSFTDARLKAEDELEQLYQKIDEVEDKEVSSKERDVKRLKDEEEIAKLDYNNASRTLDNIMALQDLELDKFEVAMANLERYFSNDEDIEVAIEEEKKITEIKKQTIANLRDPTIPKMHSLQRPYRKPCLVVDREDSEFSSKSRKDVLPEHFFSYTHENMRKFLKGRNFMDVYGQMVSITGSKYLILQFKINASKARNNFGSLPEGALLRIKLINGDTVDLYNVKGNSGVFDKDSGGLIYSGIFLIQSENEKLLTRYEVDKVRVVWSSGFEDYEIYYLDFFINQIECLNANL
jgi:tetratricopeptide (TPR) repeat protein